MRQLILTLMILLSLTANKAISQQRYASPEKAYWDAFNSHTTPVYKGARIIQKVGYGVVNYGSRIIPRRYGAPLRHTYNQVNNYVQRKVTLPRRYHPNNSNFRRK